MCALVYHQIVRFRKPSLAIFANEFTLWSHFTTKIRPTVIVINSHYCEHCAYDCFFFFFRLSFFVLSLPQHRLFVFVYFFFARYSRLRMRLKYSAHVRFRHSIFSWFFSSTNSFFALQFFIFISLRVLLTCVWCQLWWLDCSDLKWNKEGEKKTVFNTFIYHAILLIRFVCINFAFNIRRKCWMILTVPAIAHIYNSFHQWRTVRFHFFSFPFHSTIFYLQ